MGGGTVDKWCMMGGKVSQQREGWEIDDEGEDGEMGSREDGSLNS